MKSPLRTALVLLALLAVLVEARAAKSAADPFEFNDQPLEEELSYPDWFKLSFLDLRDDLAEAVESDKRGLIVYFGQKRCPYCQKLLEVNWGEPDIVAYTRSHFDVVPINIWGIDEITDLRGARLSEHDFAQREGLNFTPSLIFYDREGREALRLRGYYPPYTFRAALEYVADGHYLREPFRDYLARAEPTIPADEGELNEEDFFSPPPYNLDRSRFPGQRPLVVFFEHPNCHACDVLHARPLHDPRVFHPLEHLDSVQLNMWSDTPVVTPDGRRTTAKQWAAELGLFHAPSLLFFDESGREILRIDSVVQIFRLSSVLEYVLSGDYKEQPSYQEWRLTHRP